MLTNANITIYNKVENPVKRIVEWNRTVLRNVYAHSTTKASFVNDSARRANESIIRIPTDCDLYGEYVPEELYRKLDSKASNWTIQTGDLIVIGECDIEITGISTLENNAVKVLRVLSVNDDRHGLNPHFRVVCE